MVQECTVSEDPEPLEAGMIRELTLGPIKDVLAVTVTAPAP